ncbi:MAG TPA: PAS domain-containing protein, partial [Opitutaceae bacterium]|nr:PAS domain-containing protein [Opitutaceae bacterium]
MSSLPTLPQRSWLERASLALAWLLMGIGGTTIFGWLLNLPEVLQPFGERAPLVFNGALSFLVIGTVLLGFELRRPLAFLAVVPAILGALTAMEYFTSSPSGIDELVVRDHLLIDTEHAGRMSLVLALGVLVCSVLLIWRATHRAARARLIAEAVLGSLVAAGGLSTLLGYTVGLPAVYHWGTATATGPVAAIGLLLAGFALVALGWRESMRLDGEAPYWSPMPAVIGCLTLTVILWGSLGDRERVTLRQKAQVTSEALASEIKLQLDQQTNRFERLAGRRADTPDTAVGAWEADVQSQFEESRHLGCVLIAYVDTTGRTRWYYPTTGREDAVNFDHMTVEQRANALTLARRPPFNPVISVSTSIHVPPSDVRKGIVIYAPVVRGGQAIGLVAGEFIYEGLFASISALRQRPDAEYIVTISLGPEVLYTSSAEGARNADLAFEKTYNIADRRLRLTLTPSQASLAKNRSYLPELALAAGFGLTLLLGLSVHLARSARAGQRAAELSNKRLFGENEERRRIEARLKVSDERLRLALDSTQIGIFEWSVAAGHIYYSPGLWAMLGYEHTRMPSTVEAWQSLIHPDDLPLYRRRTESQLNGIASFIEPEYRVRARSGDWRWVYTRAKSVANNADGKPTRIIGTVQDITARREAEIALRESQAEARKLSLVAAKTDNPVLIGAPDGRIEWANEAFCRVMEYSLEEVVGKNPMHF